MSKKNPDLRGGFTLLELVVVLAILAVVATLATREIGYVQDQGRFETSQRGLDEIKAAILGQPGSRSSDGAMDVNGFVADMGRLPRAAFLSATNELTLSELWVNPNPAGSFDLRPATDDPDVRVPGGWRGPYIRLPLGTTTLRDGWGNAYVSPFPPVTPDPNDAGYARLRDATDNALAVAGQEVRIVRHLGANDRRDILDAGYDRDLAVTFGDEKFRAGLKGYVDIKTRDGSDPVGSNGVETVTVRVFGPDPENATLIKEWNTSVTLISSQVFWEIPVSPQGPTIGPRAVRAYLSVGSNVCWKSMVKTVTLGAGVNQLNLEINRW